MLEKVTVYLHESNGGIDLAGEVRGCFLMRSWLNGDLKDGRQPLTRMGWKRFPGRGQDQCKDPAVVGN